MREEFRQKLLEAYGELGFNIGMLVTAAWLSEDNAGTINSSEHSDIFARLEEFANSWERIDLSVYCRKFRAIIIDKSGGDKDQALAILDEGMELYGKTNSELVRAKAKVLYRAEDHQGSLELSKALIRGDVPINDIEKVFLGRETAISAEKQGDYGTAKLYYLYGSDVAAINDSPAMEPIRIGLVADAAVASWHAGDREGCLRYFVKVLQDLVYIDSKSSLRTAHCHARCWHVILCLDHDASSEKWLLADGEVARIYPGIVSNPEPSPDIGDQFITPIELVWYMLAGVENHSYLDVGINKNLESFLPKGTVLEGQYVLMSSKMEKAIVLHDPKILS